MDIDRLLAAQKELKEIIADDPERNKNFKMFRIRIEAGPGLTYDNICFGDNLDEAWEGARESICMTKGNDLGDDGSYELGEDGRMK